MAVSRLDLMWVSDGPRCVSLRADAFQRFVDFRAHVGLDAWRDILDVVGEGECDGVAPVGDEVPLDAPEGSRVVCQYCLSLCGEESWRGRLCYGDLSAILDNVPLAPDAAERDRAAWQAFGRLLGGESRDIGWVRGCFEGNCRFGLLSPDDVRSLSVELGTTRICERMVTQVKEHGDFAYGAEDLLSLQAFLSRAASEGCWVLAAEWS